MKTTLGGDRLGSGSKQIYARKHFERSTHDLSYKWRSSMSAGTLVPFMSMIALPGDSFDIDLMTEVVTLPTVGPLFGSFKVQLDVFQIPVRLYNSQLHMNRLNIGNDMTQVLLPQIEVRAWRRSEFEEGILDNAQINPSCLLKYLGISGIGRMLPSQTADIGARNFNAVPLLCYWDIYKNYYANKQEERGFAIHVGDVALAADMAIQYASFVQGLVETPCFNVEVTQNTGEGDYIKIGFGPNAQEPDPTDIDILYNQVSESLDTNFINFAWDDDQKVLTGLYAGTFGNQDFEVETQSPNPLNFTPQLLQPRLVEFDLEHIDEMRLAILQHTPSTSAFVIDHTADGPYGYPFKEITGPDENWIASEFTQESLGVKTYQSDLFNNWIDTEWIDGASGVNAVTAVDTTGDSFTIDALNLAHKVYSMLNRVALSGGTYDDWKEAVYDHYGRRSVENPVYMGSLIKELAFEEVISTAEASSGQVEQALGTLAGRGRLTGKHKGGKIKIKTDDISYIMGIVSLTPRIEYSQGNKWDVNLLNMDDFHKPDLDRIGYQDLMTGQLSWQSIQYNGDTSTVVSEPAVGKQPAWINYMTEVDRCYGNFADRDKEMFMVLNRRYDIDPTTGLISDLTTYIDPTKFNQIFADTNLDAQNFWVQIGAKVIARRKMSAKVIPNL
jgi:hypothetical protein